MKYHLLNKRVVNWLPIRDSETLLLPCLELISPTCNTSTNVFDSNKEIYDNLLKRFENENADLKKIIFLKKSKSTEFMKDYYKIDLALDTFPYTGVTTSFQSYLMGVPVLTLKGFNMNSRCGESINSNLGLNDFIADNFDDYYKKSISLQDKNKLSNLRSILRNKILSSSLFDTDDFVKDLTSVFEKILKQ